MNSQQDVAPAHFILFHIGKGNQCPPLMCSDLSRGVTTASSSTFDLSFIPAALPDTTPKGICITLKNAMLNFVAPSVVTI